MASVPAYVITARTVTVNTKATGTTVMIDPCARFWVTTDIGYRIVDSVSISSPAAVYIGSNSPGFDNLRETPIEPNGSLAGIVWVSLEPDYLDYADLTTSGLRVNVSTAATGTSQSVEIIVVGYYV